MSKQEDINLLKIETCVLKVNIHCEGCKQKVKKLIQKIDGVYKTTIDAEEGKVTVSGSMDPAILIKKLAKKGKHAELLTSKSINNSNNNFPKPQNDQGKTQQQQQKGINNNNVKPQNQKDGGGGGKDQKGQSPFPQPLQQLNPQQLQLLNPQQLQQLQLLNPQQLQQLQQLNPQQLQQLQQLQQQMKGFNGMKLPQLKDMKLPMPMPMQKDPRSVKFALPPEEGSEGEGSEFDDEDFDDDLEEIDGFDADFDDDFMTLKINKPPMNGNGIGMKGPAAAGGAGGNAKKVEIPVQIKGMNGNNEAKNGKKGGSAGGSGNGGGAPPNASNGGGAQNGKNGAPNFNKNAPNGNGGNHNGKNLGGGKNDLPMNHPKPNPNMMMGQNFRGMEMGQQKMGNMPTAAVQGLPAGAVPPPGYFQNAMAAANPEMMAAATAAAANPYQQQQYMAAMMQQQQMQQQQQRMMMMHGQDGMMYQPMMGYPRPPMQGMYMPPPTTQVQGEHYTELFSDENTNSCSIM